jgi:hypothetical protein
MQKKLNCAAKVKSTLKGRVKHDFHQQRPSTQLSVMPTEPLVQRESCDWSADNKKSSLKSHSSLSQQQDYK